MEADALRRVLHGPILSTHLWMALPNLIVILAQNAIALAELHFIGRLGAPSLARASLVLPGYILMQNASGQWRRGGFRDRAAGGRTQRRSEPLSPSRHYRR